LDKTHKKECKRKKTIEREKKLKEVETGKALCGQERGCPKRDQGEETLAKERKEVMMDLGRGRGRSRKSKKGGGTGEVEEKDLKGGWG